MALSDNHGLDQTDALRSKIDAIRRRNLQPSTSIENDELDFRTFEEELWSMYGLVGEIVPDELLKECQQRLRQTQPGSRSEMERQDELVALDLIHRLRKAQSYAFSQLYAPEKWKNAKRVPPDAQMLSKGIRFWALLIGNNAYPKAPLSGCYNDALLIYRYLLKYLDVPRDHIRILRDANRETLINAFYDLRDDERIKPDDNIVIHFSGHGSSYETQDYFTSFASQAGSIESICPVDRSDSIPDISDREINSIFSELRYTKGPNITIIFDCCYAGGAVRSLNGSDTSIRFISPIRTGDAGDAPDLMRMFEAAERNPRRRFNPNVPNISSDLWLPDYDSYVLLAACHDFQCAEEANFEEEFLNCHEADSDLGTHGMMRLPASGAASEDPKEDSARQGRFTMALVKILQSEMARNATYESVISSIGRLGRMQVPVAIGSRKHTRLWFEEMDHGIRGR